MERSRRALSLPTPQDRANLGKFEGRRRQDGVSESYTSRRSCGARWATFFGFPSGRWADEVSEQIAEGVHKLDLVEL